MNTIDINKVDVLLAWGMSAAMRWRDLIAVTIPDDCKCQPINNTILFTAIRVTLSCYQCYRCEYHHYDKDEATVTFVLSSSWSITFARCLSHNHLDGKVCY